VWNIPVVYVNIPDETQMSNTTLVNLYYNVIVHYNKDLLELCLTVYIHTFVFCQLCLHLSACNSLRDAQVPMCGTMGTVLGAYWKQFTNRHFPMNRFIFYLFLYTSRIKWAMFAGIFCSIQSTCRKSGSVYLKNIV
jgi:hypothetical protein